jgi:hypothetical protein
MPGPCLRAVKAAAMTSRISHTSFDAVNAYAQSVFWSPAPKDPWLLTERFHAS